MWLVIDSLEILLVIAYIATIALLHGSRGGSGVVGTVGLTVDTAGSPVLVLEICSGAVDTVTVVGPNRGKRTTEQFGELRARRPIAPSTGMSLDHPGTAWSGPSITLPPEGKPRDILLIASARGDRAELRQVNFTVRELMTRDPETVLYSPYSAAQQGFVNRRVPLSGFRALVCGPS